MNFMRWLTGKNNRDRATAGAPVRRIVRLRCEELEDRTVPAVVSTTFANDYVTQLYTDLLQRSVDPIGLSFWSTQITQYGESLYSIALDIQESPEARNNMANQIFEKWLGRDVDLGSQGFWAGQLGVESVEDVEASVIGSKEFFNDAGNTNVGFLNLLYEDAFNRPVDKGGEDYYLGKLASGWTRAQVACSVLTGIEYRSELVESYYETYFNRAGDAAGMSYWVGLLYAGKSDQQVIARMLSSAEFFSQIPAAPIVTTPANAVFTTATTFTITGTAEAGSLVQILNSSGTVVGTDQLEGRSTAFSVTVPLTSSAANNFTAVDQNGFGLTSAPTTVPTITQSTTVVDVISPGDQKDFENASVSLQIKAGDADDLPLTYTATNLPSGLSIDQSTGLITGVIQAGANENSPYSVTVTATDSKSNTSSTTFTWVVAAKNGLTVTAPANQVSFEGNLVSDVPVTASEDNKNPLTYSATGLPPGLSINSSTGVISGVVEQSDASSTPYTVNLSVTDSLNTATASFQWTVYKVNTVAEQANHATDSVNVAVTTTDPNTSDLTYSATGLPSGLTMNADGTITGEIDSSAASSTPYTVTVTVTDTTSGASGITTFPWLVYDTTDPLLKPPATQQSVNGDKITDVSVTATPVNGTAITYTASNLPPGLSIDSSTGKISGTISSSASDSSPYNVTVTATEGSASSTATFSWVVTSSSSSTLPYSLTNPGWITLPSGVRYQDLTVGTGTPAATAGGSVTVNYVGYLTNGTVFNSGNSFTATLATTSLIPGWVDAVPGMLPGGVRLLDIPASLAYGTQPPSGSGIPLNAELIFEITLISATA